MTEPKMISLDCPECNGTGEGPTRSECCGNPYPSGECRSHCVVQAQAQCEFCCGQGTVEVREDEVLRGSNV